MEQLQQGYRNARRASKGQYTCTNTAASLPKPASSKKPMDIGSVKPVDKKKLADLPAPQPRLKPFHEPLPLDKLGYRRVVDKMKIESLAVNEKLIGQLMEHTFDQRRAWIIQEEFMTIEKICDEFPALKNPNHVSDIFITNFYLVIYTIY